MSSSKFWDVNAQKKCPLFLHNKNVPFFLKIYMCIYHVVTGAVGMWETRKSFPSGC